MAKNQNSKGSLNYNNIEKKNKNFMYINLERSNCYNCDFSNSGFDYVSFRGAHFKSCVFFECSFKWAEFIGTNFKGSSFKNAVFENAIFDSVNLDGVNFDNATFKNTIFLNTDTKGAKRLNLQNSDIKVFDTMPQFEVSEELKTAVENSMNNKYIRNARVFDTKDKELNLINLMLLLENFNEETLIKGLNIAETELDKEFYTLSYIIRLFQNYQKNGTL